MLARRSENVFFLASESMVDFVADVDARLQAERFPGVDDPDAPMPAHYVTTLYFDTEERAIARACAQGDDNVKLRAREYSDYGPDRVRHEPHLWLEIKSRHGEETRKVRVSVPHEDIRKVISEGVIAERSLDPGASASSWSMSNRRLSRELDELRTHTDGTLRPDCLARYRRLAWQDEAGKIRITLDTELSFYRAPSDMLGRPRRLETVTSSDPAGRLDCNVVEIKLVGACPDWIEQLCLDHSMVTAQEQGRRFSKFLAASRAVHGTL
ncbi:MAG: VTC domain-containing protein [Myxococcales bacterium]|nr:VTC domain-containing protein [Myxococcales bacterium]